MLRGFLTLAAVGMAISRGADWPSEAGDPQRTSWQKHEHILTPETVKGMKMLWSLRLGHGECRNEALATPTILGHIITHRGIKALVFATGGDGAVYAVDADLGTVFWQRQLAAPDCDGQPPAAPLITPAPESAGTSAGNEDDNDPAQGNRPLYTVSGGKLHEMHPSSGNDISPPRALPSSSRGVLYPNLFGGTLYAGEPGNIWAVDLKNQTGKQASRGGNTGGAVAVGRDGVVYSTEAANAVAALAPGDLKLKEYYRLPQGGSATLAGAAPMIFRWRKREFLAVPTTDGGIVLFDAKNLAATISSESKGSQIMGLASFEVAPGTTWIYATSQSGPDRKGKVTAFRIDAKNGRMAVNRVWTSGDLIRPTAPVVAGGLVYVLADSGNAKTALYAFNALTGDELCSSLPMPLEAHSSRVAVANGHVCFGASGNTLVCFGIPEEP
jgi:outer membrane protein assembly factor BamB